MSVAVICAIKLAVPPLGRQAPFALLGIAVLGAGWLVGTGGALIATILMTVATWLLFFPPYGTFGVPSVRAALQIFSVFAEGLALTGIISAMQRARRLQQVTARRMESLQLLAASLAAARTTEDVSQILVKGMVDFLGATTGALVLPTEDEVGLWTVAMHGTLGERSPLPPAFAVSEALPVAATFRTGDTEWLESPDAHLQKYASVSAQPGPIPGATISLPLYAAGRIIGATTYQFSASRHFPESERSAIRGYVTQAAQALDRALADRREALARRRLDALAEVNLALSAAATVEEVATTVVDRGTRAMGADTCTVYGAAPGNDALELLAQRGVAPEVLESIRRIDPSSDNASFNSLPTRGAIWGESAADYATLYPRLASIASEAPRARAFWSVPLVGEGRAIGLLGMGFYSPRRFSPSERSFIETFAGHCAQALLRARRLDTEREARRRAERAEASLATTLRSIGDAVIATDLNGMVTFMNPVAEQLTGWPGEEARGKPLGAVFEIVNEQTRKPVESPVEKVLQTGLVVGLANHTVLLNRTPGREIPIDDSGAPIRDEAGEVQGVVLVFRDVTDKKHQEARRFFLAEATATLASSLDYQATLVRVAQLMVPRFADWTAVDIVDPASPMPRRLAVMHVDPQKIELAHELAQRYPERPDAETGVPHVLRTGRSELYSDISEEMVAAAARDDDHRHLLSALQLRSAMIVPLVARGRTLGAITLIHAESGRRYDTDDLTFMEDIVRRAAVVIDNAQLYASERQARVSADLANRTKDEFLATVSHELRTPLNAILGWARMMAKSPDDAQRRARAVEIIERNSVTMARLIEDLLDVSRIISGKVRLDVEGLDPMRVIHAAVDAMRPTFEAKGVEVEVKAPSPTFAEPQAAAGPKATAGDGLVVMGDNGRLHQVLCNVLSNAVKFTPTGGHIEVTLRRRPSAIEIEVADSGKGIDLDFLPHVFEPFRQADGAITRAHGGLGLGLAISRHLVELHGGKIWANSAGIGCGAQFTISLPAAAVAEEGKSGGSSRHVVGDRPGSAVAPTQVRSTLEGLRVLAVDDDPDARQLVRAILEERGATVTVASSAAEAMEAIHAHLPDILLSDIGMPHEDGYSLIRRLRALPAGAGGDLPAAALTAYSRAEDRRAVFEAGYSAHLSKPIEPDRLVATVQMLVQQQRSTQRSDTAS